MPCFRKEVHNMLKVIATTSLLTTILSTVSAPTFADPIYPNRYWNGGVVHWTVGNNYFPGRAWGPRRQWNQRHWNQRHWNNRNWNRWHGNPRYWNQRYWNQRHWNQRYWNSPHWNRWGGWNYGPNRFNRGVWGPGWNSYWNGVAVGSALSFGLNANEPDARRQHRVPEERRVVRACYRIERLPGGRERRIELPPSSCR